MRVFVIQLDLDSGVQVLQQRANYQYLSTAQGRILPLSPTRYDGTCKTFCTCMGSDSTGRSLPHTELSIHIDDLIARTCTAVVG